MNSVDVTEHLKSSGIADRIVPCLGWDISGNPRTTDDFTFALSIREPDKAVVLGIQFSGTDQLHRQMVVNAEQRRLGLMIKLSAQETAELIAKALPLLVETH